MTNQVVFPTAYTRTLAREQGLDHKGQLLLLKGTRLSPADLLEFNKYIDAETQAVIVRNALQLSNNPVLGLRWGANLHLAAHGPLGTLIASSPTLGHAWKATEKFHDTRGGFARMEGHIASDHFAVIINMGIELDEVGRFFCEAVLATMVNHLGMIIGNSSPALRIELAYSAPAYAEQYPEFLHAPCLFGRPKTKIVIPHGLALMPNPMADPETHDMALARCEQLLLEQRHPRNWAARVTELLRSNPGQIWTCEQVASHFHLSSRTLMRYLRHEYTSYQTLRDSELARQAKLSLLVSNNSVESVALSLGYQEVSNFRRAFKRWFGISPQAFIASNRVN
ncbi:MAG: AraC family transcriptional regulator [Gammaproteobacteria bacterium]|uniref:AraC family transcriptional regulator n=1 Tax=Limnobacter sp. TaxID=2003368 RepID=UPI001D905B87|nr:AraC family transcriptional regulator [Limnobacter sp.]MBU0782628.1 AraC family transcriptional regulator [Gammaproteobacteria bacterium]MBU0850216.1 AraC family transcriptional regulator [Gammaproteobacteria bacterium]MBU1266288.1 AraC family transcriptional regulator [Gammaproteobacteria bacterium]MBU1528630.1 AraC family transcriptional regulator [Gammaproteobacteria bacterium]MBU1780813.1 AraC family transcriptional regulator [Gammaproteobacteria bacterium]